MRRKKAVKLEWEEAPQIKQDIVRLISTLEIPYIPLDRIFCYRSFGSSSRSYARIWSFPKIFQHALQIEPSYVIEVLAKYYDTLDRDRQLQVLIHELLHIPKNFSGSLLPHRNSQGKHLEKTARELFQEYKRRTE
ncbi:MAG TPA: putative metallopeptidase [Patescibacteria group bacterium]|nr:putative metallopeptidase [Patescibacteria group bacterium]